MRNRLTDKPHNWGINVGSSSMLMIFVILCLISFAALSLVSANSDRRLSIKMLERTTAYYNACNRVEDSLARIDGVLAKQYADSPDIDSYFEAVGHNKSFIENIDERQMLYVEIEILYPKTAEGCFYRTISHQILQKSDK